MIRPELFLESLAVEDWREEGRQEGRREAREKARLIEVQGALSSIIHARFPNLEITSIASALDLAALRAFRALIPKVTVARDEAAVKRLIRNLR